MYLKNKGNVALLASLSLVVLAGCNRQLTGITNLVAGPQRLAGQSVPNQVMVKLKAGSNVNLNRFQVMADIKSINVFQIKLRNEAELNTLKQVVGNQGIIENDRVMEVVDPISTLMPQANFIPEFKMGASSNGSDPDSDKQWAIAKVNQLAAQQSVNGGSKDVVIAIVDSGVDLGHPDLVDKLVPGYNASGLDGLFGKGSPKDDNGHGTHCAGVAAATVGNGVGIAGMAINPRVMPVKVMAGKGAGTLFGVAKGITWAADHGADVISMSLGGPVTAKPLEDAVTYALSKNVVVVAAMGNSAQVGNAVSYPAAYNGVIAVGASDENDKIASFSTYNQFCTVAAPGVKIYSTTPTYDVWLTQNSNGKITKNYSFMNGTSMATPLVSGLVGLIRSKYPKMSPADVKALLERTADKVPAMQGNSKDVYFGSGRIDAANALK
jgi:subtilisin family serine protease